MHQVHLLYGTSSASFRLTGKLNRYESDSTDCKHLTNFRYYVPFPAPRADIIIIMCDIFFIFFLSSIKYYLYTIVKLLYIVPKLHRTDVL